MTALIDHDTAGSVDAATTREAVSDGDGIRWSAHARIDKFTVDQEAEAIRRGLADGRLTLDDEGIVQGPLGDILKASYEPYETVEVDGNLLTRQGLKRIMDRLAGTTSNQALDATHCRIGVGDTSTPAVATDTDLGASAGSTHRQFILIDSALTVGSGASSGVLTGVATFGSSVANFAWAEWGIDGGTANGTTVTSEGNTTPGLCNHKITALGTKSSSAAWVVTVTITIT